MILVKKWLYLLPLVVLGGCSSAPTELTVDPDDWVYEKRAITVSIKAPADLNSLSGRPHSLAIGVFQLSDPNTFSGLSVTTQGAVELLQKGQIDETVASFQLITIRPGEKKKVSINRTQSAQYLGMIVGYYNINPSKDVRVFPIPLRAQERGLVEKGLAALTLIADESKAYPDKLNVFVDLGRSSTRQITDDKVKAAQADDALDAGIEWSDALQHGGKLQK